VVIIVTTDEVVTP